MNRKLDNITIRAGLDTDFLKSPVRGICNDELQMCENGIVPYNPLAGYQIGQCYSFSAEKDLQEDRLFPAEAFAWANQICQ